MSTLMKNSFFVKCDCCCSMLEFRLDDDDDGQFEVSLWNSPGLTRPMPEEERVRWCKRIMETGDPWADHTILTKKNAKKLAEFILKEIQKPRKIKSYGKENKKREE